jgi:hypothetical protein
MPAAGMVILNERVVKWYVDEPTSNLDAEHCPAGLVADKLMSFFNLEFSSI